MTPITPARTKNQIKHESNGGTNRSYQRMHLGVNGEWEQLCN